VFERNGVALLLVRISPGCSSLDGLCASAHEGVSRWSLCYAQSRDNLIHLGNHQKLKRDGLLVYFLLIALVHCLCANKQDSVIEEITSDVASSFGWCFLQRTLKDKLTVLVGQF
jgi:hypothetical protein